MNLPDLLCDLRPPSSLSGTQLPVCGGIRIQLRPGCDVSPRWPLVPSAASYPCPQEWSSVGLRDLGDASYDEPSAPLPEGPLPPRFPHPEDPGSFPKAEVLGHQILVFLYLWGWAWLLEILLQTRA